VSIIPFLRDSSFDPEAVAILAAAFDAAWDALQKSGSPLASDAQAMTTRERLAKRIIEMGQKGTRDHQRLVEDAIAHLTAKGVAREAIQPESGAAYNENAGRVLGEGHHF
jgi:hypothetical protein